jgi:hypothetical protein
LTVLVVPTDIRLSVNGFVAHQEVDSFADLLGKEFGLVEFLIDNGWDGLRTLALYLEWRISPYF